MKSAAEFRVPFTRPEKSAGARTAAAILSAPVVRIAAILFDLDGTLRRHKRTNVNTFLDYLAEVGHPLPDNRRHAVTRWYHYYWAMSPEVRADKAATAEEPETFWPIYTTRLLRAAGFSGDVRSLALTICQMFKERYRPEEDVPPETRPVLTALHRAGYTLALVSNRETSLAPVVEKLGLADLFHFTLSAGEAQSWKPDPGIFLQAVSRARCAAAEAVYVGDNFYADVLGARYAGLRAVLLDPQAVFPPLACTPVIRSLGELESILKKMAGSF